jgi:hypothetical protein
VSATQDELVNLPKHRIGPLRLEHLPVHGAADFASVRERLFEPQNLTGKIDLVGHTLYQRQHHVHARLQQSGRLALTIEAIYLTGRDMLYSAGEQRGENDNKESDSHNDFKNRGLSVLC